MTAINEKSATTPTPGQKTAAARVPLWDNARFTCVTLVVIGHAVQRLTAESDNAFALYVFIYGFHIPAFAIISGYFSKATPPTVESMKRLVSDILLPYLIMETLWAFVQFLVVGWADFNPTSPSWTLWFLLALGIFRLVLPYLALLRWPLLIGVLLSIGVGYFPNVDSTFSLSRAIGILPFFLLGWKLREWGVAELLLRLQRGIWVARSIAIAVFTAWLWAAAGFTDTWREMNLRHWLFYDEAYTVIGETEWWAGGVRLALIALAALLSLALLVLIPRSQTWITGFGRATMYVYLLHSFVLYPLRETGAIGGEHSSGVWLASMVFAGIAISILLASPLVRRVFRPLIEPRPRWLFVERVER